MKTMTSRVKEDAAKDAACLLAATWPFIVPVDPVSIQKSGTEVLLTAEIGHDTMGALVKRPQEDPTILINESDGENRRRFTCAHEPATSFDGQTNPMNT